MATRSPPQYVNLPLPQTTKSYDEGNEATTRRQILSSLNIIQQRLVALEAVVQDQQPAITNPTGGATIDSQARTAIIAILDVLRELTLIEP